MELLTEHGTHRHDVPTSRQGSYCVGGAGNGGIGIERQRALRRETDLKSLGEQQRPERFAHARREHHHVEQHCGRNGHADGGEERSRAVPDE